MRADETIIFSDMDGTLLTDWSMGPIVAPFNMDAIKRFISAGGLFSIASGRQFRETLNFFEEMTFPIPLVQGNGSVIYDSVKRRVIKKTPLPEDVKLECLEYSKRKKGIWLVAADENELYHVLTGECEWDRALNDLRRRPISEEEYLTLELVKVCFVIADTSELDEVASDIQNFKSADKLRMMQSSPVFLEVLDKSAGKAAAIEEVVRLSNAGGRKLVCIGDYDNDCDMLALADIAACPSNSSPRVLEMAKLITCTNNEGAIADLINKLGLL
jgi:HAD-superfamily hydrolase, subfamily IIB